MLGSLPSFHRGSGAAALARVPGPHGIPLIAHAKAGGPAAVSVSDYVSTVLAQLENRK
jgi:hypothetical protein